MRQNLSLRGEREREREREITDSLEKALHGSIDHLRQGFEEEEMAS